MIVNESLLWKVCFGSQNFTAPEIKTLVAAAGMAEGCLCKSQVLDACAIIVKKIDDELRKKWRMSRRAKIRIGAAEYWFGNATDEVIDAWIAAGNNPGASFVLK